MSRRLSRCLAVVALVAFLPACATTRKLSYPGDEGPEESAIYAGMEVQVILTSGEKLTGEVVRFSENELVLFRPGNYGRQERAIPKSEIISIAENTIPGPVNVLLTVFGVTAVLVSLVMVTLMIGLSNTDFG